MEGFPITLEIKGQTVTVRMMTSSDGPRLLTFAQQLSDHDLLFLRRDITKQSTIDKWVQNIEDGVMHTVLAEDKMQVLGYSSLYRNDFDLHVAELRVQPASPSLGLAVPYSRRSAGIDPRIENT